MQVVDVGVDRCVFGWSSAYHFFENDSLERLYVNISLFFKLKFVFSSFCLLSIIIRRSLKDLINYGRSVYLESTVFHYVNNNECLLFTYKVVDRSNL